ncbi:hypothetical protein MJO29_000296 [Puccinia striiformis f. sp. tritici]|nr:hypothetical protein MJO29_000296 [Puccinia striiformis f. sp. tritici]
MIDNRPAKAALSCNPIESTKSLILIKSRLKDVIPETSTTLQALSYVDLVVDVIVVNRFGLVAVYPEQFNSLTRFHLSVNG